MKTQNNLSGIYFRYQNPDTGKWENWCFEDLPTYKQLEIVNGDRSIEWVRSLALSLARALKEVGDEVGISKE